MMTLSRNTGELQSTLLRRCHLSPNWYNRQRIVLSCCRIVQVIHQIILLCCRIVLSPNWSVDESTCIQGEWPVGAWSGQTVRHVAARYTHRQATATFSDRFLARRPIIF